MQICLQTKLTDIVKRKLLRKSKAASLAALIRRAALARRTVVRADRHLTARKIAIPLRVCGRHLAARQTIIQGIRRLWRQRIAQKI
jgi:hypothetical protein